jgi:aminopeptidase N
MKLPRRCALDRTARVSLIAALLVLVAGKAAARVMIPEEPHQLIDAKHSLELLRDPTNFQPAEGQDDFDVLHYDLALDIDFTAEAVAGVLTMTGESTVPALASVVLDLHDVLTVSQVDRDGTPLAYTHANHLLTITLDRSFAPGEPFTVRVTYGGQPPTGGFLAFDFGLHAGAQIVASLSEPTYARNWWPCKDVPYDKATAALHFTVPDTMVVASNGTLLGQTSPAPGKATFHWRESYPIATYLVSVTATNFTVFEDEYIAPGHDPMRVVFYSYPERLAAAQEDWSVTVPMIETFAARFGEYPFLDEKYGMAMFQWGGAMEHQTCTSYSAGLVTGDHRYDWVVAHELAHQWWGDLVTLGDWRDIWLNEGFATYSEAVWVEDQQGFAAYVDYMRRLDIGSFQGSVYNPTYLFSSTVYKKGAWVLHMLRHVLGDALFTQLLRDWAIQYAYGNAVTADFQALAESMHGQSLAWFFDEWVYNPGKPLYAYWWLPVHLGGGAWAVTLNVEQEQIDAPPFKMPIDIGVVTASGDTTWSTISDSLEVQTFTVPASGEPVALLFDPYFWILRGAVEVPPVAIGPGAPGAPELALRLAPVHPNPAPGPFAGEYTLARPGHVVLRLVDVAGRVAAQIAAGPQATGTHRFRMTQDLAPGVYFLELTAGAEVAVQRVVIAR